MPFHRLCLYALALVTLSTPVHGQDSDRIWGRVTTKSGDQHEGFLHWENSNASWADVIRGTSRLDSHIYEDWLQASESDPPTRTIDVMGYRVSWDEVHMDFPRQAEFGIRLGHVAELEMLNSGRVRVIFRGGGETPVFNPYGWRWRELSVVVPGAPPVELRWERLQSVAFSSASRSPGRDEARIYGTVTDRWKQSFSGYITWSIEGTALLGSERISGNTVEDDEDKRKHFRLDELDTVTKIGPRAIATLRSGGSVSLFDRVFGNNHIVVSDICMGTARVDWDDFQAVRFHEPPESLSPGYGGFGPVYQLAGTVVTEDAEETSGLIRWNADKEWSWQLLNGHMEDVKVYFALNQVAKIEKGELWGAVVTLLDGRSFKVGESPDLSGDNRGVLIAVADGWRFVSWEEFQEVRFNHPKSVCNPTAEEES